MKIARSAGAVVTSLGLVVGLSGFAGATAGTIGYTGPSSNNQISSYLNNNANLNNNNNLNAQNLNNQYAHSGHAGVSGNTFGGSAQTGPASNFNSSNVAANVNNAGAGYAGWFAGAAAANSVANINTTGPYSNNQVQFNTNNNLNVNNNNNFNITNTNNQSAKSGDAYVDCNTTGGSAITGAATNTNTQTVNLSVNN